MSDQNNNLHQREFIYTCPSKVFNDPTITLNELKIYMMIRSFMDTTGVAYPSNAWLASHLNINKRNTVININKLVEKGYLERIEENGRRYLTIPRAKLIQEGVSKSTTPHVVDDTLLDQSNIISKEIIKPLVDFEKSTDYKQDDLFNIFYKNYPNKQKPRVAFTAFKKLKPTEEFVSMLVEDVFNRINNNWKGRPTNKIPHPSTYLNSREWEGEIYANEVASGSSSNDSFSKFSSNTNNCSTYDQEGTSIDLWSEKL